MDKKTLKKRIDALPRTNDRTEPYIIELRKKIPRAYERWDYEETQLLLDLFRENYSSEEIAKLLERTYKAIRCQLEDLGIAHTENDLYKDQNNISAETIIKIAT